MLADTEDPLARIPYVDGVVRAEDYRSSASLLAM